MTIEKRRWKTPPELVQQICDAYPGNPSSHKLAAIYGVSQSHVLHLLRRNNVPLKKSWRKGLAEEASATVIRSYQAGETIEAIALKLGVLPVVIRNHIQSQGIHVRSLKEARRAAGLREDAFDVITEESAYWIGMLMADGCVMGPEISLGLKEEDAGHVVAFASFLGLKDRITWSTKGDKRLARFSVRNDRLANALNRYGMTERKTHTAKVYGLELNRDFWRGVVDGDGCITRMNPGSRPVLSVVGSEPLLGQFRDFAITIDSEISRRVTPKADVFTFSVTGGAAAKIVRALYEDCGVSLARKKSLADQVASETKWLSDNRAKWDHLNRETLDSLYEKHGSWASVARIIGISPASLSDLRFRRGYRKSR